MLNLDREINRINRLIEKEVNLRLDKIFSKVGLPKTPDNLVDWTTTVRIIQGQNFSFEGREFLVEIYLDKNKRIMIVKPRQMEITEYAVNWLLFNLEKNPNTVGLYLTDRKSHVSVFSRLRIRNRAIGESPILQVLTYKKGNVSLLLFKNGSMLYMYSAKPDFEAARSIPVDFAVIDEIQSTNVEAIPVLEEALAKSKFGKCLYIGTGSVMGDAWYKMWHMGDQKEYDLASGVWIAKNPDSKISSYHLTQEMAKDRLKEDLEYKLKAYTPRRYANEVQGWWYGGNEKPLTEKEMMTLFDRNLDFTPSDQVNHSLPIFAGFDWGGGTQAFTVAWIWQLVNENVPRFKLLNVVKIDDKSTEVQADKAIELIEKYQVDQVVCDEGGGARQIEKLSSRYGPRVYKCHYTHDTKEPIQLVPKTHRVNVNRTWVIDTIIDLIKRPEPSEEHPQGVPRIHLPYKYPQKIQWIIEQFTCIEAETVESSEGSYVRYVHGEETNDDALHAACYAYVAYMVKKKNDWYWVRL